MKYKTRGVEIEFATQISRGQTFRAISAPARKGCGTTKCDAGERLFPKKNALRNQNSEEHLSFKIRKMMNEAFMLRRDENQTGKFRHKRNLEAKHNA